MSNSMLVAVREAVLGDPTELNLRDPDSGLATSHQRSVPMSEIPGKPAATVSGITQAAASALGIAQADADAVVASAVSSARNEGHAAGVKEASARFSSIFGAAGIAGDGKRMAAAMSLAEKSPAMSADDVVAFVTGNVPAATAEAPAPEGDGNARSYEANRLSAAGLAAPGGQPAKKNASLSASAIFAARRQQKGN